MNSKVISECRTFSGSTRQGSQRAARAGFWRQLRLGLLWAASLALVPAPVAAETAAMTSCDSADCIDEAKRQAFEQRLRDAEAKLDAAARELRSVYQERSKSRDRGRKAMLGVLVEHDGGDRGVLLTGLTPGGGAEAAGLRARDVLVSVNGVRLDDPKDGVGSMKALTQVMANVAPGETVTVGYRRGKEEALAAVATRAHQKDLSALMDSLDVDVDIDFSDLGDELAEIAEGIAMSALTLVADAQQPPRPPEAPTGASEGLKQLAALTEELRVAATPERFVDMDAALGAYFGVEQGVLVVGTAGTASELRSGDVLLSLAGEPVDGAAAAQEQLAAAAGKVEAEVLRQGATRVLQLDSGRFQAVKRVSVIRISQDGEDVEITIDPQDG